jgi:pimeloyl-ACP methyl ester carboxylesterase
MLPIATRDYLRFGALRSLSLFRAMTRYPTLERLYNLIVPTLVIVGLRDPLVKIANAPRFAGLPHVDAVTIPGAHALHYSNPQLIAELIQAQMAGEPLVTQTGRRSVVGLVSVKPR